MDAQAIRELVKEKYGEAAARAKSGGSSCCGASPALMNVDPITSNLYSDQERQGLPADAVAASLGCGNPTALAELHAGETVLDMTEQMLALARENQRAAGVENVEFLKGEIEHIPLPDRSVDVIISNCVVNLSGEKERVLAEAFRVLRPGGRLALSDIVVRGAIPSEIRRNLELWAGCVAGALEETEYRDMLAQAGFVEIGIEPTRIYQADDVKELLVGTDLSSDLLVAQVEGKFMSAFIRAKKPAVTV